VYTIPSTLSALLVVSTSLQAQFRDPSQLQLTCAFILMHVASLLSLSALTAVVAGGPLQKGRVLTAGEIDGILTVLDRVSIGIVKVDAEVKLWLGDWDNAIRILDDARWVHMDMATGAKFIDGLPNGTISTWDSLKIAIPMTSIMKSVDSYTNGLIANKGPIGSLSLLPDFIASLQDSKNAAQELSRAITTKLPMTMAWTVAPVTDVFIRKFDKTAREFGAIPGPYSVPT
jgi:hypothetical protein